MYPLKISDINSLSILTIMFSLSLREQFSSVTENINTLYFLLVPKENIKFLLLLPCEFCFVIIQIKMRTKCHEC